MGYEIGIIELINKFNKLFFFMFIENFVRKPS